LASASTWRRLNRPGGSARLPRRAAAARAHALAASVDIPGALVGSGYVQIGKITNSSGEQVAVIGGQIDLTLRPLSLRIAAAVEVATIDDAGRQATGVYVGLNVVLPVGIPLGNSGLASSASAASSACTTSATPASVPAPACRRSRGWRPPAGSRTCW